MGRSSDAGHTPTPAAWAEASPIGGTSPQVLTQEVMEETACR